MVKLPDYTALGTQETPQPTTSVARVDNPGAAAEAQEGLGQTENKAGIDLQNMVNIADVNSAMANDFEPKLRDLAQNYYSLQGKAALDAGPQYRERVTQVLNEAAGSLNGEARTMFMKMAQPSVNSELYRASQHAGAQAKTYYAQSNDAALSNYVINYQDAVLSDPKIAQDSYDNAYHQLSMYHKSIGLSDNDPIAIDQQNILEGKFDTAKKTAIWNSFLSLPPDKQANHVMGNGWPMGETPPGSSAIPSGGHTANSPYNLGNVKTVTGAQNNTMDFVNPATPVDGVILTANTLRNGYQDMTLQQIGKKWTGESAAKVSAWVNNVSSSSGIAPGDKPDMNDPQVLAALLKGIGTAEKSPADRKIFTQDVISQGVTASMNGQQAQVAQNDNIMTDAVPEQGAKSEGAKPMFMGQEVDPEMAHKMTDAALSNTERQNRLQKLANEGEFNKTQNDFFEKEHGNQLTWADINAANLPVQGPGGKEWWQERLNKGTEKTDPAVFNDLFRRVNLPDGDPEKITDPKALLGYVGKGITPQNKSLLEKSMEDPAELKSFLKMGHDQLSSSNMMNIDGEGEQRAYNWQVAMRQKIADGNAKGISTQDLINPQSKNYIGNDIQSYQADLPTQQANMANRMRQSLPAAPLPAEKLRRKGETADEYVKRLGL